MRPWFKLTFTLILVFIALLASVWLWNYYMYTAWTRDGRIRADVITIAPDVSGWIDHLYVKDDQYVEKNDPIFTVNSARYQAALDQAKANMASAQITWEQAQHEYLRRQKLSRQSISPEDLEISRLTAASQFANYQAAQANVELAEINLARTTYTAPTNGFIVNLGLRQGDYVSQGKALMSLIRKNSFYATGYFEETKIPKIHVGDKARIWLMSGGKQLTGTVVSIGRGISNSDTTPGNALLPTIAPTFTWVRLAQRIPVDVALDEIPEETFLSAGMTVTVRVYPEKQSAQASKKIHDISSVSEN